jgi:hypothetical protein
LDHRAGRADPLREKHREYFVYSRAFSIFNRRAARPGWRDGAQGISRELCGGALKVAKVAFGQAAQEFGKKNGGFAS